METCVGVIMGSKSDWDTMRHCTKLLTSLDIPFEAKVVSAHRTPNLMYEYAKNAQERGIRVIIAAAGGAAHLPGMTASMTNLPVIGVPIKTSSLGGQDSLYSIVQMPAGVPVATVAIGEAGAKNAAILAARILGINNTDINASLTSFRDQQTKEVLNSQLELS